MFIAIHDLCIFFLPCERSAVACISSELPPGVIPLNVQNSLKADNSSCLGGFPWERTNFLHFTIDPPKDSRNFTPRLGSFACAKGHSHTRANIFSHLAGGNGCHRCFLCVRFGKNIQQIVHKELLTTTDCSTIAASVVLHTYGCLL